MKQLLKKHTFGIILVIILLVLQAYCDLKLPDYTSSIINVGIQEGGIESILPEAISEKEMDKILLFVSSEEKGEILDNYLLIEKGNNEYKKKYALVDKENIYVRKQIDKQKVKELEDDIRIPIAMVYTLRKTNIEEITSKMVGEKEEYSQITNMLPKGSDIFTVLEVLEQNQVNQISEEFKKQYENLEESMLNQSAKAYLQEQYKNVGINVEDMQIKYIAKTGAKMIGLAAIIMIVTIATTYLASIIAANFTADLRKKVVEKTMDFSSAEFIDISTSSLITRCTNDIQQVQILLVMVLRMILYAPILGIGAITKLTGSTLRRNYSSCNTCHNWIYHITVSACYAKIPKDTNINR